MFVARGKEAHNLDSFRKIIVVDKELRCVYTNGDSDVVFHYANVEMAHNAFDTIMTALQHKVVVAYI